MYDNNNIFAKIIRNEIPAKKIYEDEQICAFYDAYPQAPVHVLVIPKGPYKDFSDFITNAPKGLINNFFKKIDEIIDELGIKESYRLITNKGAQSGQTVYHFHIHILSGKEFLEN